MLKLNTKDRNIWWSSDFHYYHKNICYGDSVWDNKEKNCRKFDTTQEMSRHIVEQINKYVKEEDLLIFLGDWSFSGIQNIWNLRKQLIVKDIIFITGNHDHHIIQDKILPNCHYTAENKIIDGPNPKTYGDSRDNMFDVNAQDLFTEVKDYLEIVVNKKPVLMFHRPIEDYHDQRGDVIHLHGHSHGNCPKKPNRLDVGIDNAFNLFGEYKPFNWDDILKYA